MTDPDHGREPEPGENNPSDKPKHTGKGDNTVAVAVGVSSGVGAVGAVGGGVFWFVRRRRRI